MPFSFVWLSMTIPAALVVAVGLGVRSKANSEDAAARWQQFLFLTLAVSLVLALILPGILRELGFFLVPSLIGVLAAFLVSLANLRWWSSQQIKKTLLYILGIGILSIALAIAYYPSAISLIVPGFMIGLVIALTWKIWDWHNPWRLIALLLIGLYVAVKLDLVPSALSLNLPEWFQTIDDIATMVPSFVGIVVIARLIYSIFAGDGTMRSWKIAPSLLFAILLLLAIAYQILEAVPIDIMTDGLAFAWIIMMASLAGIASAMLLAWSLPSKRRWIAFVFALVVTLPVPSFEAIADFQPSPVVLTEQRAEQVNQAILRYRAQEGKYPKALVDLSPWYLWHIPEPIMFRSNNAWCYEGDKDYYRLGYFFHEGFGAPASVQIQGSAGTPPISEWKCDRDVANYNLSLRCGYDNRTGCQPSSEQNP